MNKIRAMLFVLAFFLWMLLSWSMDIRNILSGLVIAVGVCFLASGLFEGFPSIFNNSGRYLWFIYYVGLFIWECVKANIDGAWRVIHPDMPIKPGIVKIKTTLKSDTGLTLLANTITLRPGTMTIDIDRENGFLYIHWLDVKSTDIDKATELIAGKFEKVLKRIFG